MADEAIYKLYADIFPRLADAFSSNAKEQLTAAMGPVQQHMDTIAKDMGDSAGLEFGRKFRARVDEAIRASSGTVRVSLDLDTQSVEAKLAAIKARAAREVSTELGVDTNSAAAKLAAFTTASSGAIRAKLDLDTAAAERKVADLKAQLGRNLTTHLVLDIGTATTRLATFKEQIARATSTRLDLDTAAAKEKLAVIKAQAVMSIKLTLDTTTATAKLATLKEQAARATDTRMGLDTTAAKEKIAAIKELVGRVMSARLDLNIDAASAKIATVKERVGRVMSAKLDLNTDAAKERMAAFRTAASREIRVELFLDTSRAEAKLDRFRDKAANSARTRYNADLQADIPFDVYARIKQSTFDDATARKKVLGKDVRVPVEFDVDKVSEDKAKAARDSVDGGGGGGPSGSRRISSQVQAFQTIGIGVAATAAAGAIGGAALASAAAFFTGIGILAEHANTQVTAAFANMKIGVAASMKEAFAPFAPIMAGLINQATTTVSGLTGTFNQIAIALSPMLTTIGSGFLNAVQEGVGASVPIIQSLKPVADAAANGFLQLERGIGGFFSALTANNGATVMADGLRTLGDVLQKLGPLFGSLITDIAPLSNAILSGLVSPVLGAVTAILSGLAPAFRGLGAVLTSLGPGFAIIATGLGAVLGVSKLVTGSWFALGDTLKGLRGGFGEAGGTLQTLTDRLGVTKFASNEAALSAKELAVQNATEALATKQAIAANLEKQAAVVRTAAAEKIAAVAAAEVTAASQAEAVAIDEVTVAETASNIAMGPIIGIVVALATVVSLFAVGSNEAAKATKDFSGEIANINSAAGSIQGITNLDDATKALLATLQKYGATQQELVKAGQGDMPSLNQEAAQAKQALQDKKDEIAAQQQLIAQHQKQDLQAPTLPGPIAQGMALLNEFNQLKKDNADLAGMTEEEKQRQQAFDDLNKSIAQQAMHVDELARAWPNATQAVRDYMQANPGADLSTSMNAVDAANAKALDSVQAIVDSHKTLAQTVVTTKQAYVDAGHSEEAAGRAVEASVRAEDAANRGLTAAYQALADAKQGVIDAQQAQSDAVYAYGQAQKAVTTAIQGTITAQYALDDANYAYTQAQTAVQTAIRGVSDAVYAHGQAQAAVKTAIQGVSDAVYAHAQAQTAVKAAIQGVDDAMYAHAQAQTALKTAIQGVSDATYAYGQAQTAVQTAIQGADDATFAYGQAQTAVQTAIRGVSDAQHSETLAVTAATTAQKSLTAARRDAARQLEDMHNQLLDAAGTQAAAAYALYDAQLAAKAAGVDTTHGPVGAPTGAVGTRQLTPQQLLVPGTTPLLPSGPVTVSNEAQQKAQLALFQAQQTFNESQLSGSRLKVDTAEADKLGVSGNASVVGAQAGVVAANKAVSDSALAVTAAQNGVVVSERGLVASARSITTAQQGVITSQRALASSATAITTAQQGVISSQRAVAASATAITTAQQGVIGSQRALAASATAVSTAQQGVISSQRAVASSAIAITTAQQGVFNAQHALVDAGHAVTAAHIGVRTAADNVTTAHRNVDAAFRGVEAAGRNVDKAIRGVASAQQSIVDARQAVHDAVQSHTDALWNQQKAALATAAAHVAYNKAVGDNSAGLNENTAQGRINIKARDDARDAIQKTDKPLDWQYQQLLNLGNITGDVSGAFQANSDKLSAWMYDHLDPATIKTYDLSGNIAGVHQKLSDLNGVKVTFSAEGVGTIDATSFSNFYAGLYPNESQGSMQRILAAQAGHGDAGFTPLVHAAGGPIVGYSPSKTADNLLARVTAGEYVEPVDTVEFYGVPALDAIRAKRVPRALLTGFAAGGVVPGYAAGGPVSAGVGVPPHVAAALLTGLTLGTADTTVKALHHVMSGFRGFATGGLVDTQLPIAANRGALAAAPQAGRSLQVDANQAALLALGLTSASVNTVSAPWLKLKDVIQKSTMDLGKQVGASFTGLHDDSLKTFTSVKTDVGAQVTLTSDQVIGTGKALRATTNLTNLGVHDDTNRTYTALREQTNATNVGVQADTNRVYTALRATTNLTNLGVHDDTNRTYTALREQTNATNVGVQTDTNRIYTALRATTNATTLGIHDDTTRNFTALHDQVGASTVNLLNTTLATYRTLQVGLETTTSAISIRTRDAFNTMGVGLTTIWRNMVNAAFVNPINYIIDPTIDTGLNAVLGAVAATLGAGSAWRIAPTGKVRAFARGGPVTGPGGPTADMVPLLGSAGEYMIQASATDYYGPRFLDAINHKRLPRMAAGGPIWPFPDRNPGQYRRIDEGWDLQYAGTTPVPLLAVEPGWLSQAPSDPTGFGAAGYPLLATDTGQGTIYYGHTFTNRALLGQHVNQGQIIGMTGGAHSGGDAYSDPNWLEIGFWPPSYAKGQAMHDWLSGGVATGIGAGAGGGVNGVAAFDSSWDQIIGALSKAAPQGASPVVAGALAAVKALGEKFMATQFSSFAGGGSGVVVGDVGNINTPTGFAAALLKALGDPVSGANLASLVAWETREGGNWHNDAHFNPLNTTMPEPGATNTGSQGNIKAYLNWTQGVQGTVDTLARYPAILAALHAGTGLSGPGGFGPELLRWSGGGYSSLDEGGWLPTGHSMVVNNTGRPERVTPKDQEMRLDAHTTKELGGSDPALAEVIRQLARLNETLKRNPQATAAGIGQALGGVARGAANRGVAYTGAGY